MADNEIKPCPCCGEDMARVINDNDFFRVRCDYCGLQTEVNYKDEEAAIDSWNMRSSDWHTGTPTEEGYYLCHVQFNSEDYESDEEGYDLPYWFKDGSWNDESVRVIAWQKIEPYVEEASNG